jgi:hypothetical protein
MNRDPAYALETLFNLLYLARMTLEDRQAADAFLAMAEDELKTIAHHPAFSSAGLGPG